MNSIINLLASFYTIPAWIIFNLILGVDNTSFWDYLVLIDNKETEVSLDELNSL